MFDFLFRKKSTETSSQQPGPAATEKSQAKSSSAAAPGTAIHYHPELIEQLKHDHRALLALFGSIQQDFAAEKLGDVVTHLDAFRVAIQSHLLTENVRLYIYLEHQLEEDPVKHELIHGFRHEMDGIGKAVMGFLARYRKLSVDRNLMATFGRDLEMVGNILVSRIQREEATLYPLYLPTD